MLDTIGKYEIKRELGRGAMGTVYEGFDSVIGRRVAIKTLRTEVFEASLLPEVFTRFKREAQAAGRLSHPHIVTIFEYGEENGLPYIVMEFMSGTDLGALLSRGVRFPPEEIVRIMNQLLSALTAAHEGGVVHRDLKPANMFLLEDATLKVVDFGIAYVESSDLTQTGATIGTPAYMSPEQVLGVPVDSRSDLFSAGVVFYQLLTGDRPFTGSAHTINQKILHQEPLPPSALNPILSAAWDNVVARAMAKKPAARYASARQFAESIKLALQAEHAHDAEQRRKTAEASEHAYREADERSRDEAIRRAEAERVLRQETDAHKIELAKARLEAARRTNDETVAMAPPQSRRTKFVALLILAAAGVLLTVFYVLLYSPDRRWVDADFPGVRLQEAATQRPEVKIAAAVPAPAAAEPSTAVALNTAQMRDEAEKAAADRAGPDAKTTAGESRKAVAAARPSPGPAETVGADRPGANIEVAKIDPLVLMIKEGQALESSDVKAAVKIYRQAYREGSGQAAKILGDIFQNGKGNVQKDYAESLQWYSRAEKMGIAVPQAKGRGG